MNTREETIAAATGHAPLIEKNVAVPISDGAVLRANVYRPASAGVFPVLLAHGVYGKDVHFADAFPAQWEKLLASYPELCTNGSTGRYLRWEIVDPERWVPDGYVVIQVDARGSGQSPGYLDPFSPREIQDFFEAIEWAGAQPWSNGKVGLIGVSYYAITQWQVAALRPPHLAAIVPWEGGADHYRDFNYHGGIHSNTFTEAWWPRQITVNQHGNAATPHRDRDTGERTTGPELSDAELANNRSSYPEDVARHPLNDAWHRERSPDLRRIEVPLLSAGNWGGPGMHLRGNIEAFSRASSRDKWLSMHVGTHFESFYLPQYVALQKRFFDHFLKGIANGWESEPRVSIEVRRPGGSARRTHATFPLERTQWTKLYLDAGAGSIGAANPATSSQMRFDALGDGVSFATASFESDTELTGFVTLRLNVSSSTTDMDLFATLRMFDASDREVIFVGAHEPVPVARGWLRVSHRKIDPVMSTPYRVFRAHDAIEKIVPGEIVPVDLEIWPTSIVVPRGYRLQLTITGRDLEVAGVAGRLLHNHPDHRDAREFGGVTTITTGGEHTSYLLMPVISATSS